MWNTQKLDDFLRRMQERVNDYCADENDDTTRACGEILGFWMYELQRCKTE